MLQHKKEVRLAFCICDNGERKAGYHYDFGSSEPVNPLGHFVILALTFVNELLSTSTEDKSKVLSLKVTGLPIR
jgi:hypothetical protein